MKPTKIEKLVYSMMTETTGTSFLDSGDYYGRHWEKNQKKTIEQFIAEPTVILDGVDEAKNKGLDTTEIVVTVNLFKYLTSGVLELDRVCDTFNRHKTEDWDGDYWGTDSWGTKYLNKRFKVGDGWNTYNGDETISQTLQGYNIHCFGNESNFEYPDYVLLQVHNGCDVRGGYTNAKLFKCNGYISPTPTVLCSVDGECLQTETIHLVDWHCLPVELNKNSVVGEAELAGY